MKVVSPVGLQTPSFLHNGSGLLQYVKLHFSYTYNLSADISSIGARSFSDFPYVMFFTQALKKPLLQQKRKFDVT